MDQFIERQVETNPMTMIDAIFGFVPVEGRG